MTAYPKPAKRIKDTRLLRTFAARMSSCAICGEGRNAGLQSHHVLLRSRGGDDVVANLVALCNNDHRLVHDGHKGTRHLLGQHIAGRRPDVLEYLQQKMGFSGASEFLWKEYGS